MQIQIVKVDIEVGKPGPKGWSKAVVTYMNNGATRTQNVMSFTNPAVYKAVQQLIGETVEVTLTKNAKGYDEWAAVEKSTGGQTGSNTGSGASATTAQPSGTRVSGSNYETPVERARRQVLIVRQSSLSNAIEVLGAGRTPDDYLTLAQEFVDWVFDEGEDDGTPE